MALEDYLEPFVRLVLTEADDGMGGKTQAWTEGETLAAGVVTDSSIEARIAYQTGAKILCTIVVGAGVALHQHDRVRCLRDGRVFRITSDSADMTTPSIAERPYAQATAEVVSA